MQNYKKYGIPSAQLIIADVPYNVGKNFYGSNPMWYNGGDNKNGESKLAGKAAFNSDFNFNLYEYFHFCSKMLKKEPKEKGKAPCMIVFCSFQQIPTMLKAAEKHGFGNNIHLTFCKNYSAQVLKANMRVVGVQRNTLLYCIRDCRKQIRQYGLEPSTDLSFIGTSCQSLTTRER